MGKKLKFGSKPDGFGLRSGNKANAPFKQMGSSPATFDPLSAKSKIGGLTTKQDSEQTLKTADLTKGLSTGNKGPGINKPEGLLTGKDKTVKEVAEADNIKKMPRIGDKETTKTPDKLETVKAPDYKVPEEKKGSWVKRAGSWIKEKAEKAKEFRESEAGAQWDKTWKGIAGTLDPKG